MGLNNFAGNNNKNSNNNNGNNNNGNGPFGNSFKYTTVGQQGSNVNPMEYLIDYNKKFVNAGKAMFRDGAVNQTMSVLIGKNKPNALLIGPAGTGKTKIVEDIAYRIASNDPTLPDKLRNMNIYELSLSNLVAGCCYQGMLEERTAAIIDFACDVKNKCILFIDEIHQLLQGETYVKIAQILKPALARGDIKVIGATTSQEATTLYKDPAFNRRFTRIIIDELTREQTIEIMRMLKNVYISHHNNKVLIDDDTLELIATIADQFTTQGSHRPDNALTLLDRTCSDAIIARKIQEENVKNDPILLAALQANPLIPITEKQIRQTAMYLLTGHAERNSFDYDSLTTNLSVIKGQDAILSDIADRIRRSSSNLFPQNKPVTFLFAGPSGVGKTEVAKIIADELTGMPPIILSMAEYHSSASINRIIGAPPGYVGSDSNMELPFDILESNPYQVILLDEFEKADRAIQRLFMGAFDEGFMRTSNGRFIDFSKATIIATTNASHTTGSNHKIGLTSNNEQSKMADTISTLSQWFDTEMLNRFTKIFTFNTLNKDIYRDIIASMYTKEITRIKKSNRHVTLPDTLDDATLDMLVADTYVAKFGARPAHKAIQDYIENNAI